MKTILKILITLPLIWVIGYLLGAVTTGRIAYINFERLISVPIFLLFLAGIFFIITKVIGSTNKKIVKNNYRPQSDSNINIKKINTKNESAKKVLDQTENISLEEVNIILEEEEEIYAKVSKEVDSQDRKEGTWTKALIQSDGDESKAKITYMKLRVEQLKNDLLKLKSEQQKEILLKEQQKENEAKEFFNNNSAVKGLKLFSLGISFLSYHQPRGMLSVHWHTARAARRTPPYANARRAPLPLQ